MSLSSSGPSTAGQTSTCACVAVNGAFGSKKPGNGNRRHAADVDRHVLVGVAHALAREPLQPAAAERLLLEPAQAFDCQQLVDVPRQLVGKLLELEEPTTMAPSSTWSARPPEPAPSLDVKQVDDRQSVPFAGPGVADARCPAGYKLVGGGWGTRDAVADGADVYDYTGGNPPGGGEGTGGPEAYDVGAATANPFGGTVYARAYCSKLN